MTTQLMPSHDNQLNVAEIVAANVRLYAAMAGIKQARLADALGYPRSNVSSKFKGRTNWRLEELGNVAGVLGVSPADLVTPHLGFTERMARPKGLEPPTFWFAVFLLLSRMTFTVAKSNSRF